jgi:hypothetical protein
MNRYSVARVGRDSLSEAMIPKVYRSMRKLADDKPVIEASPKGLGVRVGPASSVADVDLDDEGHVILNGKGMSVAPGWRNLPDYSVPRRLKGLFRSARGPDDLYCFTMGAGPFRNGPLAADLDLQLDSPTHGSVVPRERVQLDKFQSDLANTRTCWTIDEA